MYSVIWNSLCFIITVLIGASHQRATGLETSDTENYSGTDNLQVFADPVDRWKNISDIKVPIGSSGLPINRRTNNCQPCRCGVTSKSPGIVGGNSTTVEKYPWMAYISLRRKEITSFCGGSLINNKYVMTAAHCFFNTKESFQVMVKEVYPVWLIHLIVEYPVLIPKGIRLFGAEHVAVQLLRHSQFNYKEIMVEEIIIHEKYTPSSKDNDIALLRLKHEGLDIGPESKYHPVCLPPAGCSFAEFYGIATGWGLTSNDGQPSDELKEVRIQITAKATCHDIITDVTNNMMCAGLPLGGKDICDGDSGGPLHIERDSKYYVVGIVTGNFECAQPNSPSIFMRVNKYLDWLAENTQDACSCSEE